MQNLGQRLRTWVLRADAAAAPPRRAASSRMGSLERTTLGSAPLCCVRANAGAIPSPVNRQVAPRLRSAVQSSMSRMVCRAGGSVVLPPRGRRVLFRRAPNEPSQHPSGQTGTNEQQTRALTRRAVAQFDTHVRAPESESAPRQLM